MLVGGNYGEKYTNNTHDVKRINTHALGTSNYYRFIDAMILNYMLLIYTNAEFEK